MYDWIIWNYKHRLSPRSFRHSCFPILDGKVSAARSSCRKTSPSFRKTDIIRRVETTEVASQSLAHWKRRVGKEVWRGRKMRVCREPMSMRRQRAVISIISGKMRDSLGGQNPVRPSSIRGGFTAGSVTRFGERLIATCAKGLLESISCKSSSQTLAFQHNGASVDICLLDSPGIESRW